MTGDPVQLEIDTEHHTAWERARAFGFDMNQLKYLMSLTPEQRLERHEQALALVCELRKAGIEHYGYDPRLAANTPLIE